MMLVWAALFAAGWMAIESSVNPSAYYMFGPEIRAFLGTIVCYASVNAAVNKLIANGVIP